jgi:hypothetical protein
MPAIMSKSMEPAKMTTVKRVDIVRAVVIKLLPMKYFFKLNHGVLSFFFAK